MTITSYFRIRGALPNTTPIPVLTTPAPVVPTTPLATLPPLPPLPTTQPPPIILPTITPPSLITPFPIVPPPPIVVPTLLPPPILPPTGGVTCSSYGPVGIQRIVPGMVEWCNLNCHRGYCPPNYCVCIS